MTADRVPVRRALLSVHDKSGLDDLARGLHSAGVALVSTGSTAAHIAAAGIPVTPVEELTGFPECLDGRVKTLHPRVHAGILADRRREDHVRRLAELQVEPFDLVPNRAPDEARRVGRYVLENDEHVDVLVARQQSTKDGVVVRFDDVWARRVTLEFDAGTNLYVPTIDDLILTKRWAMRDKDLADIRLLEVLKEAEQKP